MSVWENYRDPAPYTKWEFFVHKTIHGQFADLFRTKGDVEYIKLRGVSVKDDTGRLFKYAPIALPVVKSLSTQMKNLSIRQGDCMWIRVGEEEQVPDKPSIKFRSLYVIKQ